jgi:crossover junction endodeoxyribonuclease RusA
MSGGVRWSPEYFDSYKRRAAIEKRKGVKANTPKDEHTNFIVRLPWPPSVNHSHELNTDGSRRLSDEAKRFRENAALVAKFEYEKQGYLTLQGPVSVTVVFVPPDGRSGDVDNRLKALLDALQHGGVYANDRQVRHLEATLLDPMIPGEGSCMVTVKTWGH